MNIYAKEKYLGSTPILRKCNQFWPNMIVQTAETFAFLEIMEKKLVKPTDFCYNKMQKRFSYPKRKAIESEDFDIWAIQ